MVYTEEQVKKLIDIAFLKGKEAAMMTSVDIINRTIKNHNGPEDNPITQQKKIDTFLSLLCGR
jgi:hypothetical protein